MSAYGALDYGKLVFACLIPLLHIPFSGNIPQILAQYISRIGVPYFFAVSGLLLSDSIEKRGKGAACKRYIKRIARVLTLWLMIYSPLLVVTMRDKTNIVQELVFRTPAYLWYLSALLFACIPFCLVKERKYLYSISGFLYIFGTLGGGVLYMAYRGIGSI